MSQFKIQDGVLLEYYGSESEVFVPEGVTEIGNFAFMERSNTVIWKRRIHLPDSLKKIGKNAFWRCRYLQSINIPAGVQEIGESAFAFCETLSELSIPQGVTCIAENLCYGCSSLQSINIPAAVTRIGAHAFEGTKLKRFELPQGLEQIEDGVFACCEDLESFFIPATVTEISESTFCRMHGEIIVEEGNPVYTSENGALYRDGGKTLMYVPPQADYAFTIPPRVEHITSYALYRSFVWRRITLHSGIKNIGDEAIRAAQICAPIGVPPEQIGKNAFCLRSGSDSLTFCELPIDYLPQEAYRRRLALGFCINHARYAPEYAENYMAYIRQNLETLKSMANKQKLKQVQEFLAEIEAQMPLTVPADYSKLKSEEKVQLLERMVLQGDAQQVEAVMKGCKKFEFTARALGIACRYRTLDEVRVLVENGATFEYENKSTFKTRYAAAIRTAYSKTDHWASYELMLAYTGLNPVISSINAPAYDVHFGGLPLIEREENTAEERAAITEYLLQQKAIDPSYVLIYALMWGCRPVAESLIRNGVVIDEKVPAVCAMLSGSLKLDARSEMLVTLPLLSQEACAFALEQYGLAAQRAGIKIALPQKLFEEKDTVLLTEKVLAQVVCYADTKKIGKGAILDAVVLRNDAAALAVLAHAGWLSKKAQIDKLIQLASNSQCAEAAAWLMNYMNQTVDMTKETEKEEKKAMRELNANPLSVTALKKLWLFKTLENGMLEITSYKGDAVDVEVPAMIGKDVVYAIGDEAFSAVTGNKSVKNKESRAKIETVVIPEGIAVIGNRAFEECTSLRKVELPSTLIGIGNYAFRGCEALGAVHLPEELKVLGSGVFKDCRALERINIPKGIKAVSRGMVEGCEKLSVENGFLIIDQRVFAYEGHEECVTVPAGVTELADGAFSSGDVIREIRLPDGLRRIGACAFSGLTALEKVDLPDSMKEIDTGAFGRCRSLKSIHIPKGITVLQESVFERCVGLCKVELPAGLKKINDHAFERCKALKEISIPHGVTTIGYAAFRWAGLETLYIPDTVKNVESQAVADMIDLKEIWLPDSIRELEGWFLGRINTDEVRIHVVPESRLAEDIWYKNLVYDYGV